MKCFSKRSPDRVVEIPCAQTLRRPSWKVPHPLFNWRAVDNARSAGKGPTAGDRRYWLRRDTAMELRSVVNILEKNSIDRENILLTEIVCRNYVDVNGSHSRYVRRQALPPCAASLYVYPARVLSTCSKNRFMRLELIRARQLISA